MPIGTLSPLKRRTSFIQLEPSAQGDIIHTDRIPRKELMDEARTARRRAAFACFGGNGRSAGFPAMLYRLHRVLDS